MVTLMVALMVEYWEAPKVQQRVQYLEKQMAPSMDQWASTMAWWMASTRLMAARMPMGQPMAELMPWVKPRRRARNGWADGLSETSLTEGVDDGPLDGTDEEEG